MLGLKLHHVCERGHWHQRTDTVRPEQNGCHFADNIFKCLFINRSLVFYLTNVEKLSMESFRNNCQFVIFMHAISCSIPCSVLTLTSDWLTTVKYWCVSHVWRHQHDIYKEKGTSLMTSQCWSKPPFAFLTTAMWPSNSVFIRWFKSDKRNRWDVKVVEKF